MDNKQVKEMLRQNTNMTEHDIDKHIRDGVIVYESYEEFKSEWNAGLNPEDEAGNEWERLDKMEYNGKEYRIDFIL